MSFASEAAFDAPPVGRHFDFSKAVGAAQRLWQKRAWPNICDVSDLVYRKSAATGIALVSPFLWLEENCGSDFDATHPVPKKTMSIKEHRRGFSGYAGMTAVAGATFMAALFAPTNFSSRAHIQDYEPDFTVVSQSEAVESEEVPTFPVMYSREWHEGRAELIRNYEERRAHAESVVVPVYETAAQDVQGVQVTSFMSEDEYSGF